MTTGPVEVRAACESALAELADAVGTSGVLGTREEWAAALGAAQRVIDVASAVQDAAIVRLAAIEPEWLDDGTEVESHRALGHAALDAPAIVSGVLVTSAQHAENRVRAALHLAADGPAGTDTETGLGGLHAAMASGRLDGYRAGVVADELEHAPAAVRASVVAALEGHFEVEDAAHLRRRCRRVLARISPDLLRQRAARARAESGLHRWADEPGVDHWNGTFPSEEAAAAWAAIDALAQQYVADGVCATIDRARAKALTDLVAGHATVTTVLTVTVPAAALPLAGETETKTETETETSRSATPAAPDVRMAIAEGDLVEVTGPGAGEPVLVSRQWLADTAETATTEVAPCHPVTGALVKDDALASRSASTAGDEGDSGSSASSVARQGDTEVPAADPTTMTDRAAGAPKPQPEPDPHRDAVAAVVSAAAAIGADAYRPSKRMATRIRARDRRCRFPGCTVAAVFCDLDHVRPWPRGRTADDNLLCLCRRHHRIKQRPGWRVTLRSDGVAIWTDPTGRVRTTHPVDALRATVLTTPPGTPAAEVSTSRARTVLPDGPHSALEFLLEHQLAPPPERHGRPAPRPLTSWHDDHGRRRHVDVSRLAQVLVLDRVAGPCPRVARRGRRTFPDVPPF